MSEQTQGQRIGAIMREFCVPNVVPATMIGMATEIDRLRRRVAELEAERERLANA